MSILQTLSRMLGVREDQTEDALRSVPRAREAVVLSRRGFFAAGAVMAAAPLVPERLYSFGLVELSFHDELERIVGKLPSYYYDKIETWRALDPKEITPPEYGSVAFPFVATGLCVIAIDEYCAFEVKK